MATVHKHVQHLVEKGFLRKAWNRSRSVEPVEAPGDGARLPAPRSGSWRPAMPIEAIEDRDTIDVPRELVPQAWRRASCCGWQGESMIDEQILRRGLRDRRERRSEARDGETVVALVRGERRATLKKLDRAAAPRCDSSPSQRGA